MKNPAKIETERRLRNYLDSRTAIDYSKLEREAGVPLGSLGRWYRGDLTKGKPSTISAANLDKVVSRLQDSYGLAPPPK